VQFAHGGFGHALEFFAKEIGAAGIAFLGAEFFLGSLLKVGGLGGNEEGIEFGFEAGGKKGEIGGESQEAEQIEGFFGGDGVGVKDDAIGATDLIAEHAGFFLDQFLAGVVLEFDELADDFEEAVEDLAFGFAEGGLVGDLEEIAEGFGSFSVEATNGEAELVD